MKPNESLFLSICCLIILVNNQSTCTKTKANRASAVSLLEKINEVARVLCKSTKANHILNLRSKGSSDELISCVAKVLQTSSSGFLWSILGETFQTAGDKVKANTCFREATRSNGKVSKFIENWHFIGPFVIGKAEVDGDPLEEWGGVKNVSRYRWNRKFVLYSELVSQGEIKWMEIKQQQAGEPVLVSPSVNWNELVMSLQSMGITEWQGWASGDFFVNEDGVTLLIQCLGVHTVYIGDSVVTGDVYRRDQFWSSVHLYRGIHTVYLHLRSKGPFTFTCNMKLLENKPTYQVLSPQFLPDILDGKLFSSFISIPINNLHSTSWLKVSKVSLVKQSAGPTLSVRLLPQDQMFSIAPGQVRPVNIKLEYKSRGYKKDSTHHGHDVTCSDLNIVLRINTNKGQDQKLTVTLRCRTQRQSFLFTFLDHDGSVQHGAAITPLITCSSGSCPVLLTLHGTTVPPQNQADSYKRMENEDWVFGVEHLWLVAPTRHGAHNWEGPGELTAMMALRSLASYTKEAPWIKTKADENLVVFAGHSMGGHGAWHLGTHYPDHALALISAAGWIQKEGYGDSNLFFRHDISVSHTSPAVKNVMEACIAENDADKHVSNLHGMPIMIRIGAEDRTVHPYYTRRMFRLLREQRSNVTYSEVANKEHWWWDTFQTNDGGVVNDPVIRNFAINHAKIQGKEEADSSACKVQDKENCVGSSDASEKYKSPETVTVGSKNTVTQGDFRLTVYNPATNTGMKGVRILQQIVPFRPSTVDVSINSNHVALTTNNVAHLSLHEPPTTSMNWHERSIEIDGVNFTTQELKACKDSIISLCTAEDTVWQLCQDKVFESELSRGPANMGPARRIAESPFLIVTGSSAQQAHSETLLRQFAVYIANLYFLTSEAWVPVVMDTALDEKTADQYNLIIVGSPVENSWAARYHDKVPLKYQERTLSLGRCSFSSPQTGALFLAPHAGSKLALVISGNSVEGIRDAVHLATPTIPPMTRSPFSNMVPDYVITGPHFRARGPGGYLCTGFWNNRWGYGRELSSCVC